MKYWVTNALLIIYLMVCCNNKTSVVSYSPTIEFNCKYAYYTCDPCANFILSDIKDDYYEFLRNKRVFINIDTNLSAEVVADIENVLIY